MKVDQKRTPKRSEVLPGIRTQDGWGLELDFSVTIGGQVCIPIEQCGPDDSPLAERKANALRLGYAASMEDALAELLAASTRVERAVFSSVEKQRQAHERWVLARAVAHDLLTKVCGGVA